MEKTLCLYRATTMDGLCAALVMSLATPEGSVAYGKQASIDVRALRNHYVNAHTLYLLGYGGGDMSFIVTCCAQFERVVLIDHHRRSLDMLGGKIPPNFEPILASTQSTSMQCVAHFRPTLTPAQASMLAYVEDHELKRYALPDTRAFMRGLLALNIAGPSDLYAANVERTIESGRVLLTEQQRVVGELMDHGTFDVEVMGVRCSAVECDDPYVVVFACKNTSNLCSTGTLWKRRHTQCWSGILPCASWRASKAWWCFARFAPRPTSIRL